MMGVAGVARGAPLVATLATAAVAAAGRMSAETLELTEPWAVTNVTAMASVGATRQVARATPRLVVFPAFEFTRDRTAKRPAILRIVSAPRLQCLPRRGEGSGGARSCASLFVGIVPGQ